MPIGVYDVRVVDYGYWRGSPQGSVRAAESRLFRRWNSKIKPNKSCKKFHARKLSFFVVAFSKMILVMGCKAAKRLYSLASHSQNR